jgi:ABC-2 type transport system ATP-binding protein
MIELAHVSKTYAGKGAKAVDELTWTVEDGKITGFFGPNGAGKSTTLKMICGVNSVDEGTLDELKTAHPGVSLEQIFLEMTADE